MALTTEYLPLLTALFTALAAVLIAPVVQLYVGSKQASASKVNAEAALINARNSGRHRIANFRQEWIYTLRNSFAEFHSIMMSEESFPRSKNVEKELTMVWTKIELLLNAEEKAFQNVLVIMKQMHTIASSQERFRLDQEFIAAAQLILKTEWNRVKQELTQAS